MMPVLNNPKHEKFAQELSKEIARIRELFSYDGEAGHLVRLVSQGKVKKGKIAGCLRSDGYLSVRFDKKGYLAHRLIWALVYGEWPVEIDHINGNRADNRLQNLRLATKSQNQANKGIQKNNTSGFKGVTRTRFGKWRVQIQWKAKLMHFGHHSSKEEAAAVYCKAAKELFGEYARVR